MNSGTSAGPAALIRALRGPVVLVTVGSLFGWHQTGGRPFSDTWPVLLIVLGLMKLAEYMVRPKPDTAGGAQ